MRQVAQDDPRFLRMPTSLPAPEELKTELILLDVGFNRTAASVLELDHLRGGLLQRVQQERIAGATLLREPLQGEGLHATTIAHGCGNRRDPLIRPYFLPVIRRDLPRDFLRAACVMAFDQQLIITRQQPFDRVVSAKA